MRRRQKATLFKIFIFLLVLPFLLISLYQVQQYLTRAAGVKADIKIDANFELENINPPWNSFAQGGEESTDMIAPVVSQMSALEPRFIRIDHIYDHYDLVGRNSSGNLIFNFTQLDQMVNSILKAGATPFFSLSYMPPALTSSGNILDMPKNLDEWSLVVQKTIEHYSGTSSMNLKDVHYEVWNEPDLFGKFSYYGNKNYLTLYTYAAIGAKNAQGVNQFKIGGPGITAPYKNWLTQFVQHVDKFKLRLDFISWHRYSPDPSIYSKDVAEVTRWLFFYVDYVGKPKIVSEWGFDSKIHPGYDTNLAAAHAVAVARQTNIGYDSMLAFEVIDGPSSDGALYWGRWGLFTHPQKSLIAKPRYWAFNMLRQLSGVRLLVEGEGTWVKALSGKSPTGEILVLLTNYDIDNRNVETVPITLNNLENGAYTQTTQDLQGKTYTKNIEINGPYQFTQIMLPNTVYLFKFTRL
jgi:hypothetical protein